MFRRMQKERHKSPQKSLLISYRKPGLWGHLGHFGFWPKLPFWSFWPAISEPGLTRRQKVPLGSCLNQQDRDTCGFIRVRSHGKRAVINEDPNWVSVGFGGFWWVLAGFGGLWRALAGLSGFIGFCRVLSGFIGFYRVYRVLSGFILPLFIKPPQLAATAALLLLLLLLLFPAMATAAASTRAIPIPISRFFRSVFFFAPRAPEWAKKKITSASTRQHAVFRPDRDRRVQGLSREARARSAVPPSVAFEQPQTADGKPPSGQAAAGQTQTQLDTRRGVERHPRKGRARRA